MAKITAMDRQPNSYLTTGSKLLLIGVILLLGFWGFVITAISWPSTSSSPVSIAWTGLLVLPALAVVLFLYRRGWDRTNVVTVAALVGIQLAAPVMSWFIFRNT